MNEYKDTSIGFVYCFSNPLMPGIYKIGMTTRTPEERLKEANSSNTWKPPAPYQIEMYKQVKNPLKTETALHRLLERFCTRIHSRREFFRLTLEEVRMFFNLMEGGELYLTRGYVYNSEIQGEIKEGGAAIQGDIKERESDDESEIDVALDALVARQAQAPQVNNNNIFNRFAFDGDMTQFGKW